MIYLANHIVPIRRIFAIEIPVEVPRSDKYGIVFHVRKVKIASTSPINYTLLRNS